MARFPRQFFRAVAATIAGYTGPAGEPAFNLDTNRLHMQDGSTPGGHAVRLLSDTVVTSEVEHTPAGALRDVLLDDALVTLGNHDIQTITRTVTTPAVAPNVGFAYIVPASATGAWSGQADNIAVCTDDSPVTWAFITPTTRMRVWSDEDKAFYTWSGSAWVIVGAGIADDSVTPAKLDAGTVSKQSLLRARIGLGVHGSDIASAATIDLQAATGDLVDVTGTTAITAITLSDGEVRTVRFTGALTLTHGASLVLPGAANITTAAGDFAIFRGYAAGVVRCVLFSPATPAATATEQEAGTSLQKFVTPGTQHRHPSAAKAWNSFGFSGGVPTTLAVYNVSGYTDVGVGVTTANLSTAFSSANWAAVGQKLLTTHVSYAPRINQQTTGGVQWVILDDANVGADLAVCWTGHGDQ